MTAASQKTELLRPNPQAVDHGVYDRIKGGHIRPRIAKTFRFEDVVEAYQCLESNQRIGKVVLTVGA